LSPPELTGALVDDEIAQAQRQDIELGQLIELKEKGLVLPEDSPLQKYTRLWPQLQMKGSRLVRLPPANSDAASPQVVLPRSLIPKVLSQLHSTPTGGHLGVQKLQGKVKDCFFWLGWFHDVQKWCRECTDYASQKTQGRTPCAPLQTCMVLRAYERVALYVLGPLPETERKNKYILVIGDYFSKWTEAFPLPNQEALTIAKILVEEWVCRFGTPRSIHSDQGRSFESALFRETCQLLNIHKTRTSSYHPQSDGLVEQFNRTLLSMLSLFVEDNQLNWDLLVTYVMMAYCSSVHASTGFTPYKVVFGREMVLPVDIMLDVGAEGTGLSVSEYIMSQTLSIVMEAVKKHQVKAIKTTKTTSDRLNVFYKHTTHKDLKQKN
uniref:Gypsy retrotransposon integrase-like protein 1 n=1 Tax=Amphilophus citrinellus TaxID=61819 RepID=A0A3Q0R9N3_AMPCI